MNAPLEAPIFIAESAAMRAVVDTIRQVMASDLTVLIQGESGTGKEVVARAIHAGSPRGHRPFVAINCAAIPETLVESELFGHEPGAFTGATARRMGRFEKAHSGSVFLDEVAELSLASQAKLLRVLQEGEVHRLGGSQVTVDVRIIAATNQELPRLVAAHAFREDLYYRLKVITIALPPLRVRREEIIPLAQHFLEAFARSTGRPAALFTSEALTFMTSYRWPGNVRELAHAVERAAVLARGPEITIADLGLSSDDAISAPVTQRTLADLERDVVLSTLEHCGGNQTEAARCLGINRTTLWRKLRQWGVQG